MTSDRFRGALLGLAVGDAIGTTVEFRPRGTFAPVEDTTAAVCGQVAGAYYGEASIPSRWLERLAWADRIRELADRLRA
jgi:ADP-ribosylglycohydrolase